MEKPGDLKNSDKTLPVKPLPEKNLIERRGFLAGAATIAGGSLLACSPAGCVCCRRFARSPSAVSG